MCYRRVPKDIIEFAVEKRPEVISNLGDGGYSPLFQACTRLYEKRYHYFASRVIPGSCTGIAHSFPQH